jgi:16S rRNA (uracil1498-N3)-methyltransferase
VKTSHTSESQFFAAFSEHDRTAFLDPDESHHAIKVFRHREGDLLRMGNGQGLTVLARIQEASQQKTLVEFVEPIQVSSPPRGHLAIACLKDNDLEEVMETCGQLPLASLTLLRTDHSQEPRDSDLARTVRRLELKSIVASKQALKPWLTTVHGPISFAQWLHVCTQTMVLCDIEGEVKLPSSLLQSRESLVLAVGPEGGFSPTEIQQIKDKNAQLLSLGSTRLRAKTCPIVALGALLGMGCAL